MQDLSDLVWAANGINRPEEKKRTAPSAQNAQDVDIYLLISDSARFRMGPQELRYEWGAIDAGIGSQNIALFCAATGLKTRPRASMDKGKIKDHVVGFIST